MPARPLTDLVSPASLVLSLLLSIAPAHAARAQQDSARVVYRTREVVFVDAGRRRGLAVGDTIQLPGAVAPDTALAIVVSVAEARASARLLRPDVTVAVGQRVLFVAHPPAVVVLAPDTVSAPAGPPDSAAALPPATPQIPPVLRPRLRGGFSLEQYGSSSSAAPGVGTTVTVAGADFDVPLGGSVRLIARGNARQRSGASQSLVGTGDLTAILYQGELRVGTPADAFGLSLGRFLPAGAPGLGYLDGVRVDARVAPGLRLGAVAGFVPEAVQLQFSTQTTRAGMYTRWGQPDANSQGTLLVAADWGGGARRRTEVAGETWLRLAPRTSVSVYGEVDLPTDSGVARAQVTTLYAALNAALPLGFRGGLNIESHEPIQIWNPGFIVDTSVPLPGRISGGGFTLGHDVAGAFVDLSGSVLKRVSDVNPQYRGTLSVMRGAFLVMATGQHGDLMDYGSVLARVLVPARWLPVTVALGGAVTMTSTPGGGTTLWRYSVRPEISRSFGGGLFASCGGDISQYAGQTMTWLHAGVSYRLR